MLNKLFNLNIFKMSVQSKSLKLLFSEFLLRPITDPVYEDINNAFERSLVFMHKVW